MTLHDDGVRVWSAQGELRCMQPIFCDSCASVSTPTGTLRGDAFNFVANASGGMVCHSAEGSDHVHVTRLTQSEEDGLVVVVSMVPSVGPVACIAASPTRVAIGTAPTPRRGTLSVVSVLGGSTRSTWLPPNRHAMHVACVNDVSVYAHIVE